MKKLIFLNCLILTLLLSDYKAMSWTLYLDSPIGNDCHPQIFNLYQNPQIAHGIYVKYYTNEDNLLRYHRVLGDAGYGSVVLSGPNQNSDPRLDAWINLGQFNFSINKRVKITVQVWEAGNPQGTLQERSAWVNIYSEQYQATLPVVYENNKTVTLVSSNIIRSFTQDNCNRFISAGSYTIDIYKVEWNKTWNYGTNPVVNLDFSNSNGLAHNSQTFSNWGAIDNITQNGAHFTTFIFFIKNHIGVGDVNIWVPTNTNQAALTYTVQLPPDICLQNITIGNGQYANYFAGNSITAPCNTSYYTISSGGTSIMRAGNFILLKNGFTANSGCTFSATIGGQDDDYYNNQSNADNSIINELSYVKPGNILSIMPIDYSLNQNYPNPFNPSTLIQYGLKENVYVKITVYNILGRLVNTLVNDFQDAGYKSVIWDGTNNYGLPVSTGIYIYKIEAGNFINSKKMLLLK